jgi:HK97 gp10 family phage protein
MATLGAAEAIVPVDTGQLQESGSTGVEWQGKAVVGYVQFNAPYAAYVEFGTGIRGAASPGAGPYEYTMSWPGMRAQPYLRPALDSSRGDVLDAIRSALA